MSGCFEQSDEDKIVGQWETFYGDVWIFHKNGTLNINSLTRNWTINPSLEIISASYYIYNDPDVYEDEYQYEFLTDDKIQIRECEGWLLVGRHFNRDWGDWFTLYGVPEFEQTQDEVIINITKFFLKEYLDETYPVNSRIDDVNFDRIDIANYYQNNSYEYWNVLGKVTSITTFDIPHYPVDDEYIFTFDVKVGLSLNRDPIKRWNYYIASHKIDLID